ncbi:6-bladed beta-propeller [uncultured Draconibacterium sp.]|uniref:6-bladed beta-propeller n=1 Tax=uncultured Draconibacterium sp. TaxID=1573823 RepID=UPI002AA68579|nr:6-bladed beta-propeller [uncultured Draconibacterium sp.]
MKILITVASVLMLLLFNNCANKIKPTENELNLQNSINAKILIGESSKLIPLEYTSDSRLKEVVKAELDEKNDKIFILSNFNIFIFDSNGKFITKLKKGKGPNEISMIISFCLDQENRTIYAIDLGNRICKIDYSGEILEIKETLKFYGMAVKNINNSELLLLNNTPNDYDPYLVSKFDFSLGQITKRYIPANESEYPLLSYSMANNFSSYKKNIYFSYSSIMGLYIYENDDFTKVAAYNIGDRKVQKKFAKKFEPRRKMGAFREEALNRGLIPFLKSSFNFKEFNFIILDDGKYSCLVSSNTENKIYSSESIVDFFDLPDVKSLSSPVTITDDLLVFCCQPLDFYKNDDGVLPKKVKIGKNELYIDYDSNPFLIVVE